MMGKLESNDEIPLFHVSGASGKQILGPRARGFLICPSSKLLSFPAGVYWEESGAAPA